MVIVGIPITHADGRDNTYADAHFGRAPMYYLADTENPNNDQVIENTSDHFGGVGSPFELMQKNNVTAMFTGGMGARAIAFFQEAGIAVYRASNAPVSKLIELYKNGQLEELTEGCAHHDEHHHDDHHH